MSSQERLESLISACVEAEVRGIEFPVGLAERITAAGPRRRRWRGLSFSLALVGLATAMIAVSVPGGLVLQPQDPVRQINATVRSDDLTGKITFRYLPDHSRKWRNNGPGGSIEAGEFHEIQGTRAWRAWQCNYPLTLPKRQNAGLLVTVFSGEVDIQDIVSEFQVAPDLTKTKNVSMSSGEAVARTEKENEYLVWKSQTNLLIYVKGWQISRTELIKIAEGVIIK